ncbi:hypothetical protein [Roseivirga sp. UBA838]|uniref:hypothetical protein n=1 Tax=Roseivirga sp. UBA838 TaxID=1947393 RepID=UPI00257CBB37|nr:hypothetical protein [Roseivirga sp. UBA838]|tara:strand:+ start:31634 stop:32827 length:1194 start_codon:yes stop_codon:yes gene_type:complete
MIGLKVNFLLKKRNQKGHAFNARVIPFLSCFSVFIFSCEKGKEKLYKEGKIDDYEYHDTKLQIVDTLILGENDFFDPSSANLTYEKEGEYYCFVSRGGVIRVYDKSGKIKFLFDKKNLENHYEYPNSLPIAYEYMPKENKALLLFAGNPTLFIVNEFGKIDQKINLEFPEDLWFLKIPHLEYLNHEKLVYISVGNIIGINNSKEFFQKSPLMAAFNLEGKFIKSIGAFPKNLAEVGQFSQTPFQFFRYSQIDNKHYFLFDHEDKLRVYKDDNQLELISVRASHRSYTFNPSSIPFYSEERLPAPTNDLNHFFVKEMGKNVFYLGYQRLLKSHGDNDVYLMKVNLDKKTAYEVNLSKTFIGPFNPKLSGVIESDTLEFFLSSAFSDKVQVVKAIMDIK